MAHHALANAIAYEAIIFTFHALVALYVNAEKRDFQFFHSRNNFLSTIFFNGLLFSQSCL